MVMVALAQRLGLDVECVHIVYGNRSVSQQELSLITDFCTHINVKLWVYEIEWLKRAEIDRAFYESMTRTLRFAIYKTFPNRTVLLGHIQDDVIENIWTNFAKGQHLENLAKMTSHATEDGVRIGRPWLQVDKADIYKVAEELHIPHLKKNTTPAWSNRGKFRNTFHPAITAQFGPATDKKVLEVAETLRKQSDIIQNLLYKPVLDSWVKTPTGGILDITPIQTAGGIDAHGWLHILTHISHVHCGISKPSIHACESLVSRIVRPCIITMKKDMRIHIYTKDEKWFAAVHITMGTII